MLCIHIDCLHESSYRNRQRCSVVHWHLGGNYLCRERVKQRLALYQGVVPIHMQFSDDAEETFSRAISSLLVRPCAGKLHCWSFCSFHSSDNLNLVLLTLHISVSVVISFHFVLLTRGLNVEQKAQHVKKGDYVTLVQSGVTSIWREESTHHIQVRKVEGWGARQDGEILIAPSRSVIIIQRVIFNVLWGDCYAELHLVSHALNR
jgi:hypothetical protein